MLSRAALLKASTEAPQNPGRTRFVTLGEHHDELVAHPGALAA